MLIRQAPNLLRLTLAALSLSLLGLGLSQPAPAETPSLVRFAVIGDSGSGDEYQYRVAQQMAEWHQRLPFRLVLTLGDNIYGGWLNRGGGEKKYFAERFDKPYAALLDRGVIFRASLGNHDTEYRNGQDLIEARERFHIDGPQGYYHFTAGEWRPGAATEPQPLVEFFALNTIRMAEGGQDPDQFAWLDRALAASRARWRIVYGHHPLYSTGGAHGSDLALRARLEPLFRAPAGPGGLPRVHVALAGHDHIYQRFRPQHGVAYFVCGASGQLRRGDALPSPEVEAVEDQLRVFMLWEATPDLLRFRAINEEGRAFDCGFVSPSGQSQSVPCGALADFR